MTEAARVSAEAETFGRQLLKAVFPHETTRPRLLETHISWVILTGEWAYKVKKPVRFDFLDYSTPELREQFCLRELEINRAWAPQFYRDVVPIFACGEESEAAYRVGACGESPRDGECLVDHAVRMVEFPQSALLSQRLSSGQVSPVQMHSLGRSLAELHQRLPAVTADADLVRRGVIGPARDNLDYLRQHLAADDPDRGRCEQIGEWTREELGRLEGLLESRARSGRVRACHGDLHLDNLLLLDDQFVPFDGIEFNDSLRQIEGWNELAFLAMELSEHGFAGHARRLIDAYAEAADDYEGLMLLRFFLVYRAMVRAKVDLIRQEQRSSARGEDAAIQGDPPSPRERQNAETAPKLSTDGRRYLDYAMQVLRPGVPELWLTHGLSGSGKSTWSGKLVERRGYIRLRSDVQRKRLAGLDPWSPSDPADASWLYGSEWTSRTYERLGELAAKVLRSGRGVVIDAAFLTRAQRQPLLDLAAHADVPAGILVCSASDEELRRRLDGRRGDPSDATVEVLRGQQTLVEPPTADECARIISAETWDELR
ncbi:MAG: hypothetical protein EA381_12100 [Planctomycetaceae bacterium]|nr:MAG: hypothetical protein EA381_12100 [Planctomycetaceae bacterium]